MKTIIFTLSLIVLVSAKSLEKPTAQNTEHEHEHNQTDTTETENRNRRVGEIEHEPEEITPTNTEEFVQKVEEKLESFVKEIITKVDAALALVGEIVCPLLDRFREIEDEPEEATLPNLDEIRQKLLETAFQRFSSIFPSLKGTNIDEYLQNPVVNSKHLMFLPMSKGLEPHEAAQKYEDIFKNLGNETMAILFEDVDQFKEIFIERFCPGFDRDVEESPSESHQETKQEIANLKEKLKVLKVKKLLTETLVEVFTDNTSDGKASERLQVLVKVLVTSLETGAKRLDKVRQELEKLESVAI